jgi:hypothetical protein
MRRKFFKVFTHSCFTFEQYCIFTLSANKQSVMCHHVTNSYKISYGTGSTEKFSLLPIMKDCDSNFRRECTIGTCNCSEYDPDKSGRTCLDCDHRAAKHVLAAIPQTGNSILGHRDIGHLLGHREIRVFREIQFHWGIVIE